MPRPDKASLEAIYKDSILPEDEPQLCPPECIMRYRYDEWNWIEVTIGEIGVEIRSNGGQMNLTPRGGNTVEVHLRERK
jgi:hypothetical protein